MVSAATPLLLLLSLFCPDHTQYLQSNRPPAIEDYELPERYHRKAFSQDEIDYINRGGPE